MGTVVSAWVLVSACDERPFAIGDCVLYNEAPSSGLGIVERVKEPRSGALMRLLGMLELPSGWHFVAKHVREICNVAADGLSRWD